MNKSLKLFTLILMLFSYIGVALLITQTCSGVRNKRVLTNAESNIEDKSSKKSVTNPKKKKKRRNSKKEQLIPEDLNITDPVELNFDDLDLDREIHESEVSNYEVSQDKTSESYNDIGLNLKYVTYLNGEGERSHSFGLKYEIIENQVIFKYETDYSDSIQRSSYYGVFPVSSFINFHLGYKKGQTKTRKFKLIDQGLEFHKGFFNNNLAVSYLLTMSPYSIDSSDFMAVNHKVDLGIKNIFERVNLHFSLQNNTYHNKEEDNFTPLESETKFGIGISVDF